MEDKELENGYDEVRHRKLFIQKHYDMQCIKHTNLIRFQWHIMSELLSQTDLIILPKDKNIGSYVMPHMDYIKVYLN